jgi:hypothetical protein
MKCLVYGIYILDVVQSALITDIEFRIFVTNFGNVQVFNRIETAWLIPILTAIGEPSRTEHERVTSNIPPSHILRSGILRASDQNFGTIEENCRGHYCCKFSNEVYFISKLIGVKMLHVTQLSFIQLGAGIADGIHVEQKKYYTALWSTRPTVFQWTSIAVWTTTQVCSQFSNDITCRCGILGAFFAI